MGDEDFLDEIGSDKDPPVEAPTAPEPVTEPEPAETPNEPEPAAEPEAEPTPAPQAEPTPEPPHVPLAAHLDEREKRQKAEALAQQREAELAQIRAAQQPPQAPDPDTDPVGFANYQQAEFQKIILNERLNTSERFARKEHGAEAVESAKAWAQEKFASDPLYRQQILGDADPYDRLVSDHRREQFFTQVSDPSELDEFRAWKAAKGQIAQQQAAPAAPPNPTPSIPAPSLASAPSAGGILTEPELTEQAIFEEVIPKG